MHPLPVELLLEIFRWATEFHYSSLCFTADYIPFQELDSNDRRESTNRRTKRNISLVCRQWREIAAQLLYSDIRIIHGAEGLKGALQKPTSDGRNYGAWVQRALLPFSSTTTGPYNSSTSSSLSIDILNLCSHLQTLIRPQHLASSIPRFDFEAHDTSFTSLERLEWWHNNEAERSGGINSLSAVLGNTPNLTYLFIGGLAGQTRIGILPVSLPKLTTLRLRLIDGLLLHRMVHFWSLPSLCHLVLDAPGLSPENLSILWKAFGSRLQTVEFGRHLRFLFDDTISSCLQSCPALETLNCHVFFITYPKLTEPHYTLGTVGLHAAANPFLTEAGSAWALLEAHFDSLLGGRFPFLQRIVLHGDWKEVVTHPRFETILQCARPVGRCIVYPNGAAVS